MTTSKLLPHYYYYIKFLVILSSSLKSLVADWARSPKTEPGAHYFEGQLSLSIRRPSGCTVASSVAGIVVVCNCSQMRTSKCTCLIFGVSIGLDPCQKRTKGIFDGSKFKVTCNISPTISGWLLVSVIQKTVSKH